MKKIIGDKFYVQKRDLYFLLTQRCSLKENVKFTEEDNTEEYVEITNPDVILYINSIDAIINENIINETALTVVKDNLEYLENKYAEYKEVYSNTYDETYLDGMKYLRHKINQVKELSGPRKTLVLTKGDTK